MRIWVRHSFFLSFLEEVCVVISRSADFGQQPGTVAIFFFFLTGEGRWIIFCSYILGVSCSAMCKPARIVPRSISIY